MLAICTSTSAKDLPINARVMGETDETEFAFLEIGKEYKVYGVMFYSTRTDFLVSPDHSGPMWVPSNIFDIKDDTLPNNWGCIITDKKEGYADLYECFGINALCGYLDLIRSYKHYIGILDREPEELQKFYTYKEGAI